MRRRTVKGPGKANVPARSITHPPLLSFWAYLIALHELGHVVKGLKNPSRLEREAEAWVWALEESLWEPSYVDRQRICALLWRYLWRAQENKWPLPPAKHPYWELMAWWNVLERKEKGLLVLAPPR